MSKDFKVKNGLQVTTHITSSGNISASGNVLAVSMSADAFNGDGSGLTNVSAAPDAASITGSSTALSSSLAGRTATLEANPVGKTSATISGSFTALSSSIAGRAATLEGNPVYTSATISGSSTALSSSIAGRAATLEGNFVASAASISGSSTALSSSIAGRAATLEANPVGKSSATISGSWRGALSGSLLQVDNITTSGNISGSSLTTASFAKATIGTATPSNASTQLTVKGGAGGNAIAHFERTIGGTGVVKITANSSEPQISFKADNDNERFAIGVERTGGSLVIASGSSISDKEIVVVTQDDKVGINTTTPTKALQVTGDISASGTIKGGTLDAAAVSDTLAAAIVSEIDNGEIPIAKLAEDAITIAGAETDLGGTITSTAILLNGKATVSGSFTALSSSIAGRAATLEANPVGKSSATISGSFTALSSSIAGRAATLEGNFVASAASISGSSTALSSSIAGRAATLEGNPVYTSATISGSSTTLSSSIAARAATLEGNVGQAVNTDSDVTFGDVSIGESLIHTGDTDTKIQFTADVIALIAGNQTLLTISEGATDRVSIGGAVNTNLWVSSSGDTIVNSDTTGSLSTHVGAFSVNYGDATKITGSLTADGVGYGDIVKFGGTTGMTAGRCVYLKSDGSWADADATGGNAAAGMSGSLLGIAMGPNSDVDGILLRGFVEAAVVASNIVGHKIYVAANPQGRLSGDAPSANGNIVRVVGYSLTSHDEIYFNPDNTYIEVTA